MVRKSVFLRAFVAAVLYASPCAAGRSTEDRMSQTDEALHRRRGGLVVENSTGTAVEQGDSRTFRGCLDFANYNVFGRPFWISHDGQYERAARIPEHLLEAIPTLEVVSFNEAFTTRGRQLLRNNLKPYGFTHFTTVGTIYPPLHVVDAGVFIASRKPIVEEKHRRYSACYLDDCGAAKSIIYAKIEAEKDKFVHVFATHMQAWNTEKGFQIRQRQAAEFRAFVLELQLPTWEPVVMLGDLNEDSVHTPHQVSTLLGILGATVVPRSGIMQYTSDPETNKLVGMTGESNDCAEAYDKGNRHCSCCVKEWLDYVTVSNEPGRPAARGSSYIRVVPLKAKGPFQACLGASLWPWHVAADSPLCQHRRWITDLSDHYPVHARVCF